MLGGLVVLLPVAILLMVFGWIFGLISGAVRPLTHRLVEWREMREPLALLIVLGIILGLCFVIGLVVRTQIGRFVQEQIETRILAWAPGYNLIKETVRQLLGRSESPRELPSRRRNLTVPDFSETNRAQLILAERVEMNGSHVKTTLLNFGNSVLYGQNFDLLMTIPSSEIEDGSNLAI
jgi:uncharacterized membrane protein